MRCWHFWIGLFIFGAVLVAEPANDQVRTLVADAFDQPVGKPDAEGYYTCRGFLSYHPGEDWNGLGGGNTDLGDPVYTIGNGYVVYARDAHMGWGNVVLVRHVFLENGQPQTIDSMYAHLDKIVVREGQHILRGQQVGTIGSNHGMYVAHLHFEIRKNLRIGINRSGYPRDLVNYYRPGAFIAQHRKLPGTGSSAMIVINTYGISSMPNSPEKGLTFPTKPASETKSPSSQPTHSKKFRVNRFETDGF